MSVITTVRDVAKAADPGQEPPDTGYAERLVHFIPSEAIALFTAILAVGVANGTGWTVRWAMLGAVAVAVVGYSLVAYWNQLTPEGKRTVPLGPLAVLSIVGIPLVAFVAWTMTIPDTPFLQWHRWELWYGTIITAVAAVLLPLVPALMQASTSARGRRAGPCMITSLMAMSGIPLAWAAAARCISAARMRGP